MKKKTFLIEVKCGYTKLANRVDAKDNYLFANNIYNMIIKKIEQTYFAT